MRSNCLLVACALWWRRGLSKGRPTWRRSHYGWFPHFLYRQKRMSGFRLVSYVPIDPRHKILPPPLFKGRMKWGDL